MNLLLITSAIKEELQGLEDLNSKQFTFQKEKYKIILLPLGVGKLNALYNLMYWYYEVFKNDYKHHTLKEIIFLGSCGSYDFLFKQDFVFSNKFIHYDYATLIQKSKYLEEISKFIQTNQGIITKEILNQYNWEEGIINSTDSITLTKIDKDLWVQLDKEKYKNYPIFENLEVYAIAKFCEFYKIPFTSFLSVTNYVYENGSLEWQNRYKDLSKKLNNNLKKYFNSILE